MVFVHGWTLDLDMWDAQAASLAPAYRIIRLDRRGFGLSSGHPSAVGDRADLRALCEHLELGCVALVGMSQGARVALQFAESFPQMTSCVILDGPPQLGPPDAAGSDVPYNHYRELTRTQGLQAFREKWQGHALTRLRTKDPSTHELLARMISRYPGRDLAEPAGPPDVAVPHSGESVDKPILLINGEFDLDSRKHYANQLKARLRRAEYALIPDAGHLCSLDNPRIYNGVVKAFLQRYATAVPL